MVRLAAQHHVLKGAEASRFRLFQTCGVHVDAIPCAAEAQASAMDKVQTTGNL